MLSFSSFVQIIVCSRHPQGLRRWRTIFGRLFKNFSYQVTGGGWVGDGSHSVECEANITLTKWGLTHGEVHRFIHLAKLAQAAEAQEAVSVVFCTQATGWQAKVCFNRTDWDTLEAELLAAVPA